MTAADRLIVVDRDGRLTILWPDPMPETIVITAEALSRLITAEALSRLVREINTARGKEPR